MKQPTPMASQIAWSRATRRIEPVDLDDADGHEQAGGGQEHRVGVRQRDAQGDVRDSEQRQERGRVGQRERRDDAGARDQHRREADGDDRGDEQQQAELAIAARAQADGAHGSVCSSCATRERADSLERREWSKRCRRRVAGQRGGRNAAAMHER